MYDAEYYQHYSPRTYERNEYWLGFFGAIADRVAAEIAPTRALDAGCALGIFVEQLRDRGIGAEGIDVSEYAIAQVYGPVRPYCRVGSIGDDLGGHYDLITCLEVLEHLDPDLGDRAIANFCRHTDDVLFSSTPMHFRDASHLNVQPGEYWAERFARHGFYRDVDYDASFICPWAVRFRRGRDPFPRVAAAYERALSRLSQERADLRSLAHEQQEQAAAAQPLLERARQLESADAAVQAELAALRDRVAALDAELVQARGTVANMEHSLFWRARAVWAALRRLTGGARRG